jgi:hypothetical protein
MVRGFKERQKRGLFSMLMPSIIKMDVAPVLVIAQSAAIVMTFSCCGRLVTHFDL